MIFHVFRILNGGFHQNAYLQRGKKKKSLVSLSKFNIYVKKVFLSS